MASSAVPASNFGFDFLSGGIHRFILKSGHGVTSLSRTPEEPGPNLLPATTRGRELGGLGLPSSLVRRSVVPPDHVSGKRRDNNLWCFWGRRVLF